MSSPLESIVFAMIMAAGTLITSLKMFPGGSKTASTLSGMLSVMTSTVNGGVQSGEKRKAHLVFFYFIF